MYIFLLIMYIIFFPYNLFGNKENIITDSLYVKPVALKIDSYFKESEFPLYFDVTNMEEIVYSIGTTHKMINYFDKDGNIIKNISLKGKLDKYKEWSILNLQVLNNDTIYFSIGSNAIGYDLSKKLIIFHKPNCYFIKLDNYKLFSISQNIYRLYFYIFLFRCK